jgi:hypothetical protein
LGDYGTTALAWVATAAIVGGILNWVERQKATVEISFEFFKLVKFKVKKGMTKESIAKTIEKAGLPLEPGE